MSQCEPGPPPPTVFISYAHESDALRAAVKALADWLGQRGCAVLTDHAHIYRPPPEGWQVWMLACIARADVVLVVCTPMLKARYEKTASPDSGRGATYEGSIVTQHIYDAAMRNTKFFPILPEAGAVDDVPTFLKPWFNGHRFPSGYEGIRCMIFDAPPDADSSGAASAGGVRPDGEPPSIRGAHARLATKLLDAAGALPFFCALKGEFADEFPQTPIPSTTSEMVHRFEDCPAEQVQQLFYVVRRSLLAMPSNRKAGGRRQAEEAAAALYFLAACRLVDQAAHAAGAAAPGACAYVLHVPRSEHVICAVIATALFGGELRLGPGGEQDLPYPEGVFEVKVPVGGDQIAADFERAAFVALFANDRTTMAIGLDAGPLTPEQRKALAARIRTIKKVRKRSMTLVVHGLARAEAGEGFANTHQVPVMLPATEATTALLGMDVDTLLAEIREFWNELDVSKRADPHAQPPSQTSPGVQSMPEPPRVDLHISGGTPNISISTGDHSSAQSGTGHSAHVEHHEAADLVALTPILQQLAQAIGELPSAKARDTLTAHVQAAQAEAGKPGKPDPGLIRRALDQIKPAAEALDHGEKIVALCARAYQVLAPYLGLPPSP